jgi:hypothetical protein
MARHELSMAFLDPKILAHLEWLGFVQPTGLVVSAPALVRAGAILERSDAEGQHLLRDCCLERPPTPGAEPQPVITDFETFARSVLGWTFSPKGFAGMDGTPIPPELEVTLADYDETLRPDYAVRERDPRDGAPPWQLLVRALDDGRDFDRAVREGGQLDASPHSRMERLLRETGVPAGLLFNSRALRLISAPRGESSGWIEFRVDAMVQSAGRPITTAMRLLLNQRRLLTLPRDQRLGALLEDSRRFQNEVSEQLAEQVLQALYELLRGFQAAHDASGGTLLRGPLGDRPDDIYHALLTVILRLLFVLYAEEREMLPVSETFVRSYSVAGLYSRLRADAAAYPDTMGQRYGAWAQLLALFRMVHDGAEAGGVRMPPRHGVLFDPDRYPFLEGRSGAAARQVGERIQAPLVPDATIHRALDKLLVLGGERISYRALDVEQIGSVYETMMGFRLEQAAGRAVAVKAGSGGGAPTAVDLDALLAVEPAKRAKWLQDRADRKLTPKLSATVRVAASIEDLHAALGPAVDRAATPDLVPPGGMILQPSEERRRSGSHYTPRALTEPIVRTTLEPILADLGGEDGAAPQAAQILELKVCDPAMGSGAFLVEACRQLADALINAWNAHGGRPKIPPDEDEVIFARRLVAQRCLYGVDRNPVAVDLAKMSLWLVTLAREHALTFVDHALRHGDSLVGLTRGQVSSFHWNTSAPGLEAIRIGRHIQRAAALRTQIREAGEGVSDLALRDLWDATQHELDHVRLFGDLVVVAYFAGSKSAEREAQRSQLAEAVRDNDAVRHRWFIEQQRHAERPLVPFHWEIEFPEVFDRVRPGFDAIVGNPPFMSSTRAWSVLGPSYRDYLRMAHPGSDGRAVDLVAHFFRRAFALLRSGGTAGLVATNTIGQGDTRIAGLHYICRHGGRIYAAITRLRWPGSAAVVVSVVHLARGQDDVIAILNSREVVGIHSFLFPGEYEINPNPLVANVGLSFHGSKIYGGGFTFDDTGLKGLASPIAEMQRLIEQNPANAERIYPYIGGEEVNTDPKQRNRRFVISFGRMTEADARQWPDLMKIVEERVLPQRSQMGGYALADKRSAFWWQFETDAVALHEAIRNLDRCLVLSRHSSYHGVVFQPTDRIFADSLVVFPFEHFAPFAALQSRTHEIWARFFGSSIKDDLRYSPSDCLDTFAFPEGWARNAALEADGKAYYDFRAALMISNGEGLTKTYSRFHDPYERDPQIDELRRLHGELDQAVLHAYGWDDISTACEFILDYEIDEADSARKKKPWRYRWPDDVRDEVLGRLVRLNAERAAAERRSGAAAATGHGGGRRGTRPGTAVQSEGLF